MPEGATLDPRTGAFAWTPGPVAGRRLLRPVHGLRRRADRDRAGRAPLRTINPVPPQVIVVLTPSFPAVPGQSVLVHVAASSLAPITGLTLTIAGQPVTLDSQGRATYTPRRPAGSRSRPRRPTSTGWSASSSTVLKVRDPNDQTAPVVAFSPQLANARLTAATAIVGTISDTNLDTWVLDIAPLGSSTFTTLASGTAPVSPGPWPPSTRPRWPTGHTSCA